MKLKHTVRRGFTLIELIIVIGIIGILSAVFIPALSGYLTRSRLNTANADAKVIFNSMQTICQEFEFRDRATDDSVFYGAKKPKDPKNGDSLIATGSFFKDVTELKTDGYSGKPTWTAFYVVNGQVQSVIAQTYYKNSASPALESSVYFLASQKRGETAIGTQRDMITLMDDPSSTTQPMQRMARLFPDHESCSYVIRIEGYHVKGVICATTPDSPYLGGFPKKSESRGGFVGTSGNAPFNSNQEWSLDELTRSASPYAAPFGYASAIETYVDSL